MNIKSKQLSGNVSVIFLLYWIVLVAWQNINRDISGTNADTIVKIILLVMIVIYFVLHKHEKMEYFVTFGLFLLNMLISFVPESSLTMRSLLNYFFPVLLSFLTLLWGGKSEINKKQLTFFLKTVVVVSLYMALYTLIAMSGDVSQALNAGNAYGNELSSFFISNHEYALYMMAGIVSSIILIELEKSQTIILKTFYFACIMLFLFNMILTFSRTYIFATMAVIGIYTFINRRSKLSKLFIFVAIIVAAIIIAVPSLRQYVYEIILKSNTDAGRNELTELAWKTFNGGSWFEKMWGQGISAVQHYFESQTEHASIHNAYLQILLYFGGMGLLAILVFLVSHMFSAIKIVKKEVFLGAIYIALTVGVVLAMFAQTVTIFTSSLDSFFLTVFAIIIPKYVINSINSGTFENGK